MKNDENYFLQGRSLASNCGVARSYAEQLFVCGNSMFSTEHQTIALFIIYFQYET